MPRFRPREHVGPFTRRLLFAKKRPDHQVDGCLCSGNQVTCPGCADRLLYKYQMRARLGIGFGYLEEIHVSDKKAFTAATRRIGRKGGRHIVIPLADNDICIMSTVPVGGVELLEYEQVSRVDELLAKVPHVLGKRGARFSKNWPKLEELRESYDLGDRSHERAETSKELIDQSAKVLAETKGGLSHWLQVSFEAANAVVLRHIRLPLKLLANPRAHHRLHMSLGYYGVHYDFYERAAEFARDELAAIEENPEVA